MKYVIAISILMIPIVATWRVRYGPERAIRNHISAARLALTVLD